MENVLYGDPLTYHISTYLLPKDLYNIKYVNKTFYQFINTKMITRSINKEIYKRLLTYFGQYTDHFLELLYENNGIISGSFILQCILGVYWAKSDIDIYIPDGKKSEEFTSVENFVYNDLKWEWINGYGYGDDVDTNDIKITFTREYTNEHDQKLQFIHLNLGKEIDQLYNFVHKTFDFDITKNIYAKDYLSICNLHEIFTRETMFKCAFRMGSTIRRYYKYKERGFTFTNLDKLSYQRLAKNSDILYDEDGIIRAIELCNLSTIKKGPTHNTYKIIDGKKDVLHGLEYIQKDMKIIKDTLTISNKTLFLECSDTCPIKLCEKNIDHKHITTWASYKHKRPDVIFIFD